jgi:membrane protease YdiL (CAAX protease family)
MGMVTERAGQCRSQASLWANTEEDFLLAYSPRPPLHLEPGQVAERTGIWGVRMAPRPWTAAAITLSALVIASYIHEILSKFEAYRQLHQSRPYSVAESLDKITSVVICALAIWLVSRTNLRGISRELGLSAPLGPAVGFALLVSLPMLAGFALTRTLSARLEPLNLLFLTVFSPIVEEIVFRGFGVRFLQRTTGWPFWAAVWPSALLFGLGHLEQGQSLGEMAGLFFLTGAGGVAFAWLVYRWQNLWVAAALHICMNLWWELFSVARSAIGGWFPFALQNLTILLAVLGTLYWTRPSEKSAVTNTRPEKR